MLEGSTFSAFVACVAAVCWKKRKRYLEDRVPVFSVFGEEVTFILAWTMGGSFHAVAGLACMNDWSGGTAVSRSENEKQV